MDSEMVPSSSNGTPQPIGQPPTTTTVKKGVNIVLEASDEWKIQEIGFDGVEKYIRPESFSDHVGKLARKVNWPAIVGGEARYDCPSLINSDSEDSEDDKNGPLDMEKFGKAEEREVPAAGPWHVVAKNLHESLQQINVLLDNLSIVRNTDYLKPLTVGESLNQAEMIELGVSGRGVQWIWKRSALLEASSVLENSAKQRQRASSSLGLSEEYLNFVQRSKFFEELKRMRDTWRVRKTGDHIYGDLGYHIFGSKYESRCLFDIARKNLPTNCIDPESDTSSVIKVTIPRDLTRRSILNVSITKDDVSARDETQAFFEISSKSLIGADVDESIRWEHTLKWAQQTLINNDTFNSLCSDAVKLRWRMSIVRNKVLLISLFDGYLLKVELNYFPFQEGELEESGDRYLNNILREMVVSRECTRHLRPQVFVPLPVTHLPEELDCRGSKAFSTTEIEEKALKPRLLLEKLIEIAGHYHLVKMATNVLERFCVQTCDPTVQYKWMQSGRISSRAIVTLITKDYDHLITRQYVFIEISHEKITVQAKEGQLMDCHRDGQQLEYCLKYMLSSYCLNAVASLARHQWQMQLQIMYANVSAMNSEDLPAPTLVLCNMNASRTLMFMFHMNKDPEIRVRNFVLNEKTATREELQWTILDYNRLLGGTLCKKIEILLSFFNDAD